MNLRMITLTLITLALTGSFAFSQSATTVKGWNADTIVWQSTEEDGTKHAILEGDRHAAGKPFTYAMLVPAGAWDNHTHSHNHDARLFVVSGALLLAVGPNPDKKIAKSYPAGSYVFVPANLEHTMGADEKTLIIGTAEGGFETHDNASPHSH